MKVPFGNLLLFLNQSLVAEANFAGKHLMSAESEKIQAFSRLLYLVIDAGRRREKRKNARQATLLSVNSL